MCNLHKCLLAASVDLFLTDMQKSQNQNHGCSNFNHMQNWSSNKYWSFGSNVYLTRNMCPPLSYQIPTWNITCKSFLYWTTYNDGWLELILFCDRVWTWFIHEDMHFTSFQYNRVKRKNQNVTAFLFSPDDWVTGNFGCMRYFNYVLSL